MVKETTILYSGKYLYVFVFGDCKVSSKLGPDDGTLES